jgi:heavy metal sensor kinase
VSIRTRLAVAFAFVTLVLVAIGGAIFERSFGNGLRSSLEPGLRSQASSFTPTLRTAKSQASSQQTPAVLDEHDQVAQLFDRDGNLLVTTTEAGNRSVVSRTLLSRARHGDQFTDAVVGPEREPYRALTHSTAAGDVVVVATSLESTNAAVTRVRNALLIAGAVAVVVAGVGGWVLAAAALRPVERMRRTAADISEHDASARLPVPSTRDELQALATTMNHLLAELQAALQRQRAFVADAGHELRTPLAVLRTELELADRPSRTRAELLEAIGHAARETDRIEHLADDLLFLAKRDDRMDARFEAIDLLPMLECAIDATQPRADARSVDIELQADAAPRARVAPSLLRPAVDNMLANALRYSPAGATITVRLHRDHDCAVIDVLDEGPGFPPEFLSQAFQRFRRADAARGFDGGTGLGLAIVRSVAEAHGGSAEAANRAGRGAVVTIRIPTNM